MQDCKIVSPFEELHLEIHFSFATSDFKGFLHGGQLVLEPSQNQGTGYSPFLRIIHDPANPPATPVSGSANLTCRHAVCIWLFLCSGCNTLMVMGLLMNGCLEKEHQHGEET